MSAITAAAAVFAPRRVARSGRAGRAAVVCRASAGQEAGKVAVVGALMAALTTPMVVAPAQAAVRVLSDSIHIPT